MWVKKLHQFSIKSIRMLTKKKFVGNIELLSRGKQY